MAANVKQSCSDLSSSKHLSFLVKYLLPDVQSDLQKLNLQAYDPVTSGAPGENVMAGSTAEWLCLPSMLKRAESSCDPLIPMRLNKDLDLMSCVEMPQGAKLETWKQNDELTPRFCRLVNFSEETNPEGAYLSATAIKKEHRKHFQEMCSGTGFHVRDVPDERTACLAQRFEPLLNCPIDEDATVAIAIPWPEELNEWRTRQRPYQWPSSDLVNKVINGWVHLVPKAHKSSKKKDIEWRLSFSLAEIHLAQSLTEEQRLSYLALKVICHVEAKELDGFSSYFLKTVLFWTCERTPRELWTADNLGKTFLILLDEVIRCLRDGNIPNYFIPERNEIDGVHKDHLFKWLKLFEEVRRNPMAFMFPFHDIYLPLTALGVPFHEEDALGAIDKYHKGLRLIVSDASTDLESANKELFISAMFEIAFCYAAEGKFLDLRPLASHFKSLHNRLSGMTMEITLPDGQLDQVLQLIDFMEALVQHFTEDDRSEYSQRLMVMIQTNVARLCHEVSQVSDAAFQKARYLDLAKEKFYMISLSVHRDPSSSLCLANFLRKEGQLEEAIKLLEETKGFLENQRSWCDYIVFNKFTAHTVDEYLTKEFQARQEIEYWVNTFTLYSLIACCVESGQVSRGKNLMVELLRARELSKIQFSYADSCVLIGYCYLMFGDVEEALSAFREAVDDYGLDVAEWWLSHVKQFMCF